MTQQRDQVIREMCLSYRDDYDLKKLPTDPSWVRGLTDAERQGLWQTMALIYDTEIEPIINGKNRNLRGQLGRSKPRSRS